jgi:hypothetical protein
VPERLELKATASHVAEPVIEGTLPRVQAQ